VFDQFIEKLEMLAQHGAVDPYDLRLGREGQVYGAEAAQQAVGYLVPSTARRSHGTQ
jgi:hypothetical protein